MAILYADIDDILFEAGVYSVKIIISGAQRRVCVWASYVVLSNGNM